jgi:serine/threonine-protein kinase
VVARRYRLDRQLGEGGFGAVYAATRVDDGAQVALKVLADDALERVGGEGRFRREADLARRLDHPNIVRVLDDGVDESGIRFIAFELLRGRSLADELSRWGAMQPRRAAQIALAVLGALEQAHSLGIIHRDLKPANIYLLDGSEQVKVLDFGIAKSTNPGTIAGLTQAGQVLGTPAYMAVEQLTGATVTPSTDLFALGVVLAQMLLGRIPYPNESTAMDIVRERLTGQPLRIPPDLMRAPLGAVIARASASEPAQRYQSAAEMRSAIDAALASPAFSDSVLSTGPGIDTLGPTGSSVPAVVLPAAHGPSGHGYGSLPPQPGGHVPGAHTPGPYMPGPQGSGPTAGPYGPGYTQGPYGSGPVAPFAQQHTGSAAGARGGVSAVTIALASLLVAVLAVVGVGIGVWMRSGATKTAAAGDDDKPRKGKSKRAERDDERDDDQESAEESDDDDEPEDEPADGPKPRPNQLPQPTTVVPPPPPAPPPPPPAPTASTRVLQCKGAAGQNRSSLEGHLRAIGWSVTGVYQYCAGDMVNFRCRGAGGEGVTARSGDREGSAVPVRFGSPGEASAFASKAQGEPNESTLATDGAVVLILELPDAEADKLMARVCK